jgi:hypothetical protein
MLSFYFSLMDLEVTEIIGYVYEFFKSIIVKTSSVSVYLMINSNSKNGYNSTGKRERSWQILFHDTFELLLLLQGVILFNVYCCTL